MRKKQGEVEKITEDVGQEFKGQGTEGRKEFDSSIITIRGGKAMRVAFLEGKEVFAEACDG